EEAEGLAARQGGDELVILLLNRAYSAIVADELSLARLTLARLDALPHLPGWAHAAALVHRARLTLADAGERAEPDVGAALAQLTEARALFPPGSASDRRFLAHAAVLETRAHRLRGDVDGAAEAIRGAEECVVASREVGLEVRWRVAHAEVAVARQAFALADALLAEAVDLASAQRRPIEQ